MVLGTFEVGHLPLGGAMLQLVVHPRGRTWAARFASHVFSDEYDPEVAYVDVQKGPERPLEVQSREGSQWHVIESGTSGTGPPGVWSCRVADSLGSALELHAEAWQRYTALRIGGEGERELVVHPPRRAVPSATTGLAGEETLDQRRWAFVESIAQQQADMFHCLDLDHNFLLTPTELDRLSAVAMPDFLDVVGTWREAWEEVLRRWHAVPFTSFSAAIALTPWSRVARLWRRLQADGISAQHETAPRREPWRGLADREGLWGEPVGPNPACWDAAHGHGRCCLERDEGCWAGAYTFELCCVAQAPFHESEGAVDATPSGEQPRERLAAVMQRHGSDKLLNGYCPTYEVALLGVEVRRLLEVGIGTTIASAASSMYYLSRYKPGASLRAWRDYFRGALIYGMDVAPDTMFRDRRIRTALADSAEQRHVEVALAAWGFEAGSGLKWDLVIDDGLHTPEAQLATLGNLFPYVAPGGLYVMEDVNVGKRLFLRARQALSRIVGNSTLFFVDNFINETTGKPRHGSALLVIRKAPDVL